MEQPKSNPAILTPASFTPALSACVILKARTEPASRFSKNMMKKNTVIMNEAGRKC